MHKHRILGCDALRQANDFMSKEFCRQKSCMMHDVIRFQAALPIGQPYSTAQGNNIIFGNLLKHSFAFVKAVFFGDKVIMMCTRKYLLYA